MRQLSTYAMLCLGTAVHIGSAISIPSPRPADTDGLAHLNTGYDGSDPIAEICKSRQFQPTLENYWISGTDDFLRDYSKANERSSDYQKDGLFGSLAKMYLGDDTHLDCSLRGGTFLTKGCKISCSDVLKNINNLALGRKVYFALAASVGFSEVMGTMHDSLSRVPGRLSTMINLIPEAESGLSALSAQDMVQLEAQLFSEALRHAIVAAAPWNPVEQVSERASAGEARARSDYENAVQVYRVVEDGSDPYKWDKLFDPHHEISISDLDLPRSDAAGSASEDSPTPAEGWHGKAVERAKYHLRDFAVLIRSINAGELGQARESGYSVLEELFNRVGDDMGSGVDKSVKVHQQVAARAKASIAKAVEEILRGKDVDSDGSTKLSKLIAYGNYLPLGHRPNSSKIRSADPAERLAKNIFMRIFDSSFDGNKIYISCTKDAQRRRDPRKDERGPASSCQRDNSGPQNLKACVEDYTCYMYRWSERELDYLSHSKQPKGIERWDEPPFNITVKDIITSSVLSKLQGLERGESGSSLSNILKTTAGGLSSLAEPSLPGIFHLPICFSRYNWNTQVTGWGTFCDTDMHCPAKNFPCFCGPWGWETESVWQGMGVGQGKKRSNYAQHLCPRQIARKVEDPLERYMAYCALDTRRNSCFTRVNGFLKFSGKDKYCNLFRGVMELKGYETIEDIDPEVRFALTCKIKKGGRGCSMYDKMFENLGKAAVDAGYLEHEAVPKSSPPAE